MKVLCIGDIHIKVSNVPEIDEMTNKLVELATIRKPNFIVLLGDILDRHATINVYCLMRAEKIVLQLSKIAPTFLLVGNHDRPNNSNFLTDEHPFNAMKLWPNTYIIDKVSSYLFTKGTKGQEEKEGNNNNFQNLREGNIPNEDEFRFVFAAYVSPGRLDEALNTIENPYTNVECFFGHQEIMSCKMGAIVSTVGDKWPLENPLLISGHIHDTDMLQPNMIYTGVPLMHSFADRDDKAVSMFTFSKNDENRTVWEQERIDLGLIKKITIYLTPEQIPNYEPPTNKLVKLVIRGDEASIKTVAKLDKISQLKKQGIKVVFKTIQSTEVSTNKFVSKISFRERLMSEIGQEGLTWFNKLF
jgi:DNA repair exonuclease SbcCD nuclease subunit